MEFLIRLIQGMDQNNGHFYYFSGEVKRVLNKMDESRRFFYKYIELNESQQKDQRSDSILYVACYENPKGFCRQRTGWVHHLLANGFYDKSRLEEDVVEKSHWAEKALIQAKLALDFYPSGFEQLTPTKVIKVIMENFKK